MATQSPPIVSIQAPKDVSIGEIEAELRQIWQNYGAADSSGHPAATRATTFTFVVYEPEETQTLLAALRFYNGPVDGITGPLTVSALKAAQKAYGLPRSGKADAATLVRLREELAHASANAPFSQGGDSAKGVESINIGTSGIADAIAASNPCRIIALCPIAGEDMGVSAQVAAYCPMNKQTQGALVCCEYITLRGTAEALERVGGIISALLIGDLPKFLWWKATPNINNGLFKRLAAICNSVIVDSSAFNKPEKELLETQALMEQGIPIADLNWRRLAAWQELTAEAFDPPERRAAIKEINRVTIDYEKGNSTQALMYLGWLASRLQWNPVSYKDEGGDYDIKRIHLVTADNQTVEAELAGVPTADWGDIAGDLVGLRLTSTNLDADCCTVLCSETTGCMRMEAGGGAQSCRVQQVAPMTDQKAEFLLGQQLQRWGRDMLFEDSVGVTAQILKLGQ